VVSPHSHSDTRYTSKISDIFLRFLAKIPEADNREGMKKGDYLKAILLTGTRMMDWPVIVECVRATS